MKRQELYKIIVNGEELFTALGQGEYFQRMEDLALEYYQTGSPHPDTIKTETYLEDMNG